jgi:anthranilate phosphoribosyltransferase
MKPPTTLIEAQLLPVIRDIIAEAGDSVVVVHGVVVGVDSARQHRRPAPPLLEQSRSNTTVVDKPPKAGKAAAKARKPMNRDIVMAALEQLCGADNKPIRVTALLDHLKLKGENERARGGAHLRNLIREGRVKTEIPDPNASTQLRYTYSIVRDAKSKAAA